MSKRKQDPRAGGEGFGKSAVGKSLTKAFERLEDGTARASKKKAGKKKRKKGRAGKR
jgi:hypothetical protein